MTWWQQLYDDLLASVLLESPSDEELDETARFLVRVLEIGTGSRVFDQCCGIGRLAAAVASLGAGVVAVDQALPYVERARVLAHERGVAVEAHQGDAFDFVARPACHAGYNWWTSFGYAATDAENARMIERARDSLRPGGRFALDVPNAPGLVRGFLPSTVDRRPVEGGELVLVRESALDLARSVLEKRWSYFLPDGRRVERRSTVRLYYPHELRAMFARSGFEDVTLLGSIRGEELAIESPRCIVLARRA